MAKAYIANRPVRFDRNYKVGEILPDGVISPHMGRKLTEMGRILCVDLPDTGTNATPPQGNTELPQNSADPPQSGAELSTGGQVNQGETVEAPKGASKALEISVEVAAPAEDDKNTGAAAAGEFVCEVCGRTFPSQQGLAAHSRSHKE